MQKLGKFSQAKLNQKFSKITNASCSRDYFPFHFIFCSEGLFHVNIMTKINKNTKKKKENNNHIHSGSMPY